ncbi:hypothetical protein PV08_11684 [Exophiala spinifera]|uniref:CN hydrolase domain-containing protein n=1 Tax=Exophiala spinifera TaxID=91928 RepID=A0A0D2AT63_9EURO|nr:uncharacterized protein PV08_11684 [Exophiala spinifera]KIW09908.1 hypothetical protein PV08_11684 [Exophiala spinifera]
MDISPDQKKLSSRLHQDVTLACVQMKVGIYKSENLTRARSLVLQAAQEGAKIVILPECFNSPYGTAYFRQYAETLPRSPSLSPHNPQAEEPSESFRILSSTAKEAGVYLVGGSLPELDPDQGKYYNTCLCFSPDGQLLATHRKIHLCDVDIPGKVRLQESEVLSPGNEITIVDLPGYGRLGIAICYDVRFPELAMVAARKGCFAMVYPSVFSTVTGELHWSLLARARALDNQIYVAMCSPARTFEKEYRAWGYSIIVDPLARVVAEADHAEATVYARLDSLLIEDTRRNIPLDLHRRFDVY